MPIAVLPLILLAVLLNAGAQIALKAGVNTLGPLNFSFANVFTIGLHIVLNPYIMIGLSCYVISVAVWLLVLSRIDVSMAYPMVSLSFVVNAFAAYYLFGEHLSTLRMGGIMVILLGVYLVARS